MKCRWTLQKLSLMKLISQLICIVPSNPSPPQAHLSPKCVICLPFPQAELLPKLLQTHRKQLSVYLFLNSQPQLGKSKEFNNQDLKVNINLNAILCFLSSKNSKKQTTSAKILRVSLLFIIFVELFFQTCISQYGGEKVQIYGKLQFLNDVLASQNIDSRYFYSYATNPSSPSLPYCPCSLRRP